MNEVVRHQESRCVSSMGQVGNQTHDLGSSILIQRAGRLIHQKNVGLMDKCTCDRDSLALTA